MKHKITIQRKQQNNTTHADIPSSTTEEEKIIIRIGQKWSRTFIVGGVIGKTSLNLTRTRLFGGGKCFKGGVWSSQTLNTDIVNISSIGMESTIDYQKILLAILLSAFGFGILFYTNRITTPIVLILLLFSAVIAWSLISAVIKLISVNVQGVTYSLSMSGISKDETQRFIRHVHQLAANRRQEEKLVNTKTTNTNDVQEQKTATTLTIKEKLLQLTSLYEEGLISKEEFLEKKENILKSF